MPLTLRIAKQDYWMGVLDLKDAYYSVPINPQHRKYLRFEFKDTFYELTCLPNGLALAARVLTKVMKTSNCYPEIKRIPLSDLHR